MEKGTPDLLSEANSHHPRDCQALPSQQQQGKCLYCDSDTEHPQPRVVENRTWTPSKSQGPDTAQRGSRIFLRKEINLGCLTKCVGNVHIATQKICPFLKSRCVLNFGVIQSSKLPTENIRGPVKERSVSVNNLKCGTNTSTRNLSQTIPQDIWINDWMVLDQMEWLSDQIEGTNEMVWETINQSVSQWVPKASSGDASASKNHPV